VVITEGRKIDMKYALFWKIRHVAMETKGTSFFWEMQFNAIQYILIPDDESNFSCWYTMLFSQKHVFWQNSENVPRLPWKWNIKLWVQLNNWSLDFFCRQLKSDLPEMVRFTYYLIICSQGDSKYKKYKFFIKILIIIDCHGNHFDGKHIFLCPKGKYKICVSHCKFSSFQLNSLPL